ncbi:hypothetical protein CHELA20_51256 [Hyphomicrobiales bacterium]|nr:hypothetical protein CHELA20_51256 [Hyphomicrobiales bacterium]
MNGLNAGDHEILKMVFAKIEVGKEYFMDGNGHAEPAAGPRLYFKRYSFWRSLFVKRNRRG